MTRLSHREKLVALSAIKYVVVYVATTVVVGIAVDRIMKRAR